MKLVIATPLYPPEIGGPATYAKLLEEGLPAHGIEVELVKFSEVRHLPKIIRHYAYYRRIRTALRGADAVLALDPVSVGLPASFAAQKEGKPFVVKIVGDYAWEQGQQRFGVAQTLDEFVRTKQVPFWVSVFRRIQIRVAQSATRIIVPSEYLKSIVLAWRAGILSEKIKVIYNAISPASGHPTGCKEEVGVAPEEVTRLPRPLVVTAGRLVPWKHVDGVIDAVAQLHRKGIMASLAIVGDGPNRDRLATYAEKKLGGYCVFTGTLSHADTLATIASANVFALNSSYEGLSHLLIESLMLGVPAVATEVGGNPEVVTHKKNGLLVPMKDTGSLAEALSSILTDKRLHTRLATHAKESSKLFAVETMLARTSDAMYAVRF